MYLSIIGERRVNDPFMGSLGPLSALFLTPFTVYQPFNQKMDKGNKLSPVNFMT